MPLLHGLFEFPGLEGVLISGAFTLAHGISPSVAQLEVVPQWTPYSDGGTLAVTFDRVRIEFPECRLADARLRRSQGGYVVGLTIIDRRWKWAFGAISGRYNLRLADESIDPQTQRTPQQLARLLLDAMGETNYDVSLLPDGARPMVDWDSAVPAQALADMCDALGCRVVLGLDNRVRIVRAGFGGALPEAGRVTDRIGIDPAERPDALAVVCGPTRYQARWELEAVGLDIDGAVKPIDDLSYAPAAGWRNEYPGAFVGIESARLRRLAIESVFRWYRIKREAASRSDLFDGVDQRVTELWQILPVEGVLVETARDANGRPQPVPAFVEGASWNLGTELANVARDARTVEGFQINRAEGIVEFDRPVYKLDPDDSTTAAAELFLTCAFSLRERTARLPARQTFLRQLKGTRYGTGMLALPHEEIVQTVQFDYDAQNNRTGVVTNLSDVSAEAQRFLDAAESVFEAAETQTVTYAGIVPLQPDGAIRQVTWQVGRSGATTTASRNTEHDSGRLRHADARRRERITAHVRGLMSLLRGARRRSC